MVIQGILSYIEQNLVAGYSEAQVTDTLLAAGWKAEDVTDTFAAHSNPTTSITPPAPPPNTPPTGATFTTSAVSDEVAEIARIQAEIARDTPRRNISADATSNSGGGMVGWFVARGVVQNESQATLLLIGVIILSLGASVWFIWPSSSTPNTTPLGAPITHPAGQTTQ